MRTYPGESIRDVSHSAQNLGGLGNRETQASALCRGFAYLRYEELRFILKIP